MKNTYTHKRKIITLESQIYLTEPQFSPLVKWVYPCPSGCGADSVAPGDGS